MDQVLIVDNDKEFLEKLKNYFSKIEQFDVITASDGKTAIEIFQNEKVSVLATGLNLPNLEGLELLAYVTRSYGNVPCLAMSEFGKPWYPEKSARKENLYHLAKPVEPNSILSAILVALALKDEGDSTKGFGLKSFLPLIELDNRSCRLEVSARGRKKGFLYFEDGMLIDAHCGAMRPDEAIREMLLWESVAFSISELPRMRKQKRMQISVIGLLGATVSENWRSKISGETSNSPMPPENGKEIQAAKQIASDSIMSKIEFFKTIAGYKAVGVVDADFKPISGDGLENYLDLANPSVGLDFLFDLSTTTLKSPSPCNTISYGNAEILVQILRVGNPPSESGYIVGITDANGNWRYMRHELEAVSKKAEGHSSINSPATGPRNESL